MAETLLRPILNKDLQRPGEARELTLETLSRKRLRTSNVAASE